MRDAAASLFHQAPKATISDDVAPLNELDTSGSLFKLPASPPDINRKLLQDRKDEHAVKRGSRSVDGRHVDAIPEPAKDERADIHDTLREVRAALKTIRILGQVIRNGVTSIEEKEKLAILEEIVGLGRRVLGFIYSCSGDTDLIIKHLRRRVFRMLVEIRLEEVGSAEANDAGLQEGQLGWRECRDLWKSADQIAKRYWFDLNWQATFAMVKRMGAAIALPLLDGTFERLRKSDDVLPSRLVQLAVRLGRRGKHIPSEEMVRLHEQLSKQKNRVAQVVLEAMNWERLLLFETDYKQAQQICQQMGIQVPTKSLDTSRKKFAGTGKSKHPAQRR